MSNRSSGITRAGLIEALPFASPLNRLLHHRLHRQRLEHRCVPQQVLHRLHHVHADQLCSCEMQISDAWVDADTRNGQAGAGFEVLRHKLPD